MRLCSPLSMVWESPINVFAIDLNDLLEKSFELLSFCRPIRCFIACEGNASRTDSCRKHSRQAHQLLGICCRYKFGHDSFVRLLECADPKRNFSALTEVLVFLSSKYISCCVASTKFSYCKPWSSRNFTSRTMGVLIRLDSLQRTLDLWNRSPLRLVTQKIEGLIDIVSQRMGCVVLSPVVFGKAKRTYGHHGGDP